MRSIFLFILVAVASSASPKEEAIAKQLSIMQDMSNLFARSLAELTAFAGFGLDDPMARFIVADNQPIVDELMLVHALMRNAESLHQRHSQDTGAVLRAMPFMYTLDGANQLYVMAGHYHNAMLRLNGTLPAAADDQPEDLRQHLATISGLVTEWRRMQVRASVHRTTTMRDSAVISRSWTLGDAESAASATTTTTTAAPATESTTTADPEEFSDAWMDEPEVSKRSKRMRRNAAAKTNKALKEAVTATSSPPELEATTTTTTAAAARQTASATTPGPVDMTGFEPVTRRDNRKSAAKAGVAKTTVRPATTAVTAARIASITVATAASTVMPSTTTTRRVPTTSQTTTTAAIATSATTGPATTTTTTAEPSTTTTTTAVPSTTSTSAATVVAERTTVPAAAEGRPATQNHARAPRTAGPRRWKGRGNQQGWQTARSTEDVSSLSSDSTAALPTFNPDYNPVEVAALTSQLCMHLQSASGYLAHASQICGMLLGRRLDGYTYQEIQNLLAMFPWAGQVMADMQNSAGYMNQAATVAAAAYGPRKVRSYTAPIAGTTAAPSMTTADSLTITGSPNTETMTPIGSTAATTTNPTTTDAPTTLPTSTARVTTTVSTTSAPTTQSLVTTPRTISETRVATTNTTTTTRSPVNRTGTNRAMPSFLSVLRQNLPTEEPSPTVTPPSTATTTSEEVAWVQVVRKSRK